MSDVTTGPIQTYVDDSSLSSTITSQNSTQERVSVTLTDSNLWLVDSSKLSGTTIDSQDQYTLLNLQPENQTTTSFENVNFTATTLSSTGLSTESSYLQSSLPDGSALTLTSVTGGTQLSSDGMSLTSTGTGGDSTGGTSSGGSGGGSSGSGSGSGSASAGAAPASSGSSTDSQSTDGTSTQSVSINTQTTVSPQPTVSPQTPEPVPFEVSPAIGLLLLLVMFGSKLPFRKMFGRSHRVLIS